MSQFTSSLVYNAKSKLIKGLTYQIELDKHSDKIKINERLEIIDKRKNKGVDLFCYEKLKPIEKFEAK